MSLEIRQIRPDDGLEFALEAKLLELTYQARHLPTEKYCSLMGRMIAALSECRREGMHAIAPAPTAARALDAFIDRVGLDQ